MTSEEKRLVIHVGFGKTGTSSLQNFFLRNDALLTANGIHYPATGREGHDAHHALATAARPGGGTGFDTDVPWEVYLERLAAEIAARPEPVVLLSSEIFSGRLRWRQLTALAKLFAHVDVVAYVRRQDALSISAYNQWVKADLLSLRFEELQVLPFQYDRYFTSWEAVLKGQSSRIVVRPYERGQLHGGDVIRDFMHHLFGLDVQADSDRVSEMNLSLDPATLEFKRLCNSFCPADVAMALLPALEDYLRHGKTSRTLNHDLISPAARRELLASFADGNAQVARRYLGREDGRLFLDPVPDDDTWEFYGLTLETASAIGLHILGHKHAGDAGPRILERLLAESVGEDEAVRVEKLVRGIVYDIFGQFSDRPPEADTVAMRWRKPPVAA